MVEYFYDAWGNHIVRDDSGEVKIGEKNSFRYRGYYYDVETGFYYLQSRYYDPEVGRFITIDNIDYADPETINGLNLYAYCNNNPVMFVDPTGHLFLFCLIAFMITGALLGGLKKGVEAYNNGARGWELAGQVALGVGIGTVVGALTGAGVGAGITLIGTGASAVGGAFALAEGGALSAGLVSVGQLALGGILAVESLKFGGNILFSKKDPIMSNKPPVSWTNINEGLQVYNEFGGDSHKATEFLLNKKYGYKQWDKGSRTEYNALKKWFDRIIRLWKK